MNNEKPIFDQATHYRIEIQGRVDVNWLKSFDSSAEIQIAETKQMQEDLVMIDVHTDQAGIVGLVRRLHSLGLSIIQVLVVNDGE
ncbi:MAG: hypothetical protein JSV42_00615 [Chloroflexota bacterium]|nr:MAG: hypothetical protein JSV42_00615 [Chloroflexota bacterium]